MTPTGLKQKNPLPLRLLSIFGVFLLVFSLAIIVVRSTRSAQLAPLKRASAETHDQGPSSQSDPTPQGRSFNPNASEAQAPLVGMTQISLTTKDIVYDSFRQVIYASVPSNASSFTNSVVSINPLTGQVGNTLTTGGNPNRLALSSDGKYLYVGLDGDSSIRRLDLQSQTTPTEFSLGTGSFGTPRIATDIAVLPGQPESVAVSLQGGSHDGVAIYDNGVPRTNRTPFSPPNNAIEFGADATTLYGLNNTDTEFGLRRLTVDNNGVSVTTSLPRAAGNEADLKFDNGFVYETTGAAFDSQLTGLTGRFVLPGFGYGVAPDSANNRIYFISAGVSDFYPRLLAYDMQTFLPVGNVTITGLSGWPSRLIRCGAAGVAVRTDANQIFVIQLSSIQPIAPAPVPSPVVGANSVISLQLATNDLIFDQGTQKLYASVPSSVAGIGNSLAPINPTNGNVSQPIPIGSNPTLLAISDNNQFLYAGLDGSGSVRRFDLQSQSAGPQFSLGINGSGGQMYVNDIAVQPGNPSVVAIVRYIKNISPGLIDVAVFDNGIKRSSVADDAIYAIEFGESPSTLYGVSIIDEFEKLSVSASGVSVLSSSRNTLAGAGNFKVTNGRAYGMSGQVVDVSNNEHLGTFAPSGYVVPDIAAGRVYFLSQGFQSTTATIYALDIQTFNPIAFLNVPNISGTTGGLVRWGADGLAFRTSSQVYILRTSSLQPYPNASTTFTTRPDGLRVLSLPVNDIVARPSDPTIYASVSSVAGSLGNSVVPITPGSNSVGQPIYVGSEPYKVAISESGNTLYTTLGGAPRVRRVDLQTNTAGIQFGLGSDIIDGAFYGENLAISPEDPDTVAVETFLPGLIGASELVLAHNGVLLPNKSAGNSLAFLGSYLYTYSNDSTEFGLRKLAINSNGFTQVGFVPNLVQGFGHRIKITNGRIYGSDGSVAEPDSLALMGRFNRSDAGVWVAPDPVNNRVYFLGIHEFNSNLLKVTAYDTTTFREVGSLTLSDIKTSDIAVGTFIHYGSDGLAFTTSDGKIYFLSTSMIPPISQTPIPTPVDVTPEVKRLILPVGDLAYSKLDGMIYASVPTRADLSRPTITFGNTIVPINPQTATLGQPIFAGSEPKWLRASADGQFIYAALNGEGAVGRLNVQSQTFGSKFSLGNTIGPGGPLFVEDMEIAPGTISTLAIARRHPNGHFNVAIYDDGIQRPIVTDTGFPHHTDLNNILEFSSSPSTLYGLNLVNTMSRDLHRMDVTFSGVQVVNKISNVLSGFDIKFDSGLIYTTTGQVVNPQTGTVVGTFTGIGNCDRLVYPESSTGSVYFLDDNCNGTVTIRAFNQTTRALTGSVIVPGVSGTARSFIRWGTRGFAFSTAPAGVSQGNQLFIIQSSIVPDAVPTPTPTPTPSPTPAGTPVLQFNSSTYFIGEGSPSVNVVVTRTGNLNIASSVDYQTGDSDNFTLGCSATGVNQTAAFGRCDFAPVVGRLSFAAGESTKSIFIPIINDAYAEANENFRVVLGNAIGGTLGALTLTTVTIMDNDFGNGSNPILQTTDAGIAFAVRQHYLDFLGREPEPGEPWSAILRGCSNQFNINPLDPSAACDRLTVSGAFFGSPEFRDKGVFVIDFYRVALNRLPSYPEFVLDLASITGTSAQETAARRAAFTNQFVSHPDFLSTASLSNSAYVTTLMSGSNGQGYNLNQITTPDPDNPESPVRVTLTTNDLINRLNATTLTKAQVLRAIAQSDEVTNIEAVRAFVASQYYGYLRRTPDTAGLNAWMNYLNAHPNDFRTMVNGFLNSQEYRLRFGPP